MGKHIRSITEGDSMLPKYLGLFLGRAAIRILIVIMVSLVSLASEYLSDVIESPGIYLQEDVSDTGAYVNRAAKVTFGRKEKKLYGKHVIVTVNLKGLKESRYGAFYRYSIRDATRVDRDYALLSETSILQRDTDKLYEIDGLIIGRWVRRKDIYTEVIPVLKPVAIDVAEDGAMPRENTTLVKEVSDVTDEESGITAALEQIVYSEDMTSLNVRIDNHGGKEMLLYDIEPYCYGEKVSLPWGNSVYAIEPEDASYGWADGEMRIYVCETAVLEADAPIEIKVTYCTFASSEEQGEADASDPPELTLKYIPSGTEARGQGE